MAQRVIHGIQGNFLLTLNSVTYQGRFNRWTCSVNTDANDATGFGSVWRQREIGLSDASGQAAGYLTDGTAIDNPGVGILNTGKVQITLTADSGSNLTFQAIAINITIVADENSNDRLSFTYVSDGAVTQTWASS